jgi:rhodanese-related sulfurtransferase
MLISFLLALSAAAISSSRVSTRHAARPVFASAQGAVVTQCNQARAAHILVDTEDLIDTIRTQVENGIAFGDIARTVSLCTSRSRGGELGWFSAGMMTPEFESACFAADVDSMVKVRTNFGWHLIRVYDKRHNPTDIMPTELRARIAAGDAASVQFVDARNPPELLLASISGVDWINLPFNEYSDWGDKVVAGEILDPKKETIVICHHGMRSSRISQFLLQNGFSSVVSVMGGIDAYAIEADDKVPRYQNEMKGEECSSCG